MSAAITFLTELAEKLRTQDNAYTASPNYCIQEHRLVCGIDEAYANQIGWFDQENDYQQADEKKSKALDRYYDRYNREPDGWTRTGYDWQWCYTGLSFLTKDAADAYVASQNHRHENEIRAYADSHYRNHEMREVRRLLAGPVQDCIAALAGGMKTAGGMYLLRAELLETALAALETAKEPQQ